MLRLTFSTMKSEAMDLNPTTGRYSKHFYISDLIKQKRLKTCIYSFCRCAFLGISEFAACLWLWKHVCMYIHCTRLLVFTHKGACTFKLQEITRGQSHMTLCVTKVFLNRAAAHLIEYKTLPFLNILSSLLSVVTSWKWAPFSLAKNRSGFHMESNIEGSRSRESSGYSEYASLGSFHCWRRKMFTR